MFTVADYKAVGIKEHAIQWCVDSQVIPETIAPIKQPRLSLATKKAIANASGDLGQKIYVTSDKANAELTKKFPLCAYGNTHRLENLNLRITYNTACQRWAIETC